MYTPTPADVAFVSTTARGPNQKFALMILLKVFQKLGYFPAPKLIPGAIIGHIRGEMELPKDLVPDITPRTLYKYHAAIRTHLKINGDIKHIRHVALKAISEVVLVMDDPADLINVAIETLVKENCELPAFSTLDLLVRHLRNLAHQRIFQTVLSRLTEAEQALLEKLVETNPTGYFTEFNRLREAPKSATLTHLEDWTTRLTWLLSLGNMARLLEDLAPAKITHFAAEARALHADDLRDFTLPKRLTLLVCLIYQETISTRDEIADMFLKRMSKLHDRAREELERLRASERKITEHLVEVLADLLQTTTETEDDAKVGSLVREVFQREGGIATLQEQCEQVSAHHGNRYQPFLWRFYASHRKALFQVLKVLDIHATTADHSLMNAVTFILEHEHDPKKYLEATIDLSFANGDWLRTIQKRRRGKDWFIRQHLETCVLTYVATELKTGDLCIRGSEQFADYRDQLLSWEACEPQVADYCQQLGFETSAQGFVENLKRWLTEVALEVDRTKPENQELVITEKGEPMLKKPLRKTAPRSFAKLETAVAERMPESHVLDVLCRIDYWTKWTRHLGPLSGADPKMEDARARHILTAFAYASYLGPYQLARHFHGEITGDMLATINRRHVTVEKLEAAIRDIINRFNRCPLPRCWGTGKRVAADGTQYDLAEENLLAEKHIRYGGFGGIAYHHVSDMYILLFSHFIACGVWEAVHIIDGLMKNQSDIQPDTIHADTQGQNLPVFALSHLLGIKLMPRIRNWKDLKFYRPSKDTHYQHIESLFCEEAIDWELIQTHWQDLLRVVLSIKAGKVLPSMLLRKLTSYSRKNRLYQAFRELGCVIRTVFLLQYISDAKLREIIQQTTNKMEQFNAFSKWLSFGNDGKINALTTEESEKHIKYVDLLANAVILDNTFQLSKILKELIEEGWSITRDELAMLSPYMTHHVKRFGNYVMDLETLPQPIEDDFPIPV
ncbi:Tn3 family transposase [Ktedonobacter robiniae]|nr:Tn3 family transposase [Ktedonobacter robiniae]